VFAQVNGLGCIDLGDRRSRVQISAARQTNTLFEQVFRCSRGFWADSGNPLRPRELCNGPDIGRLQLLAWAGQQILIGVVVLYLPTTTTYDVDCNPEGGSWSVPSVDEVTQKVQRILANKFSTRLGRDGDFFVDRGSTTCRVWCREWGPEDKGHVLVCLSSPVLFEVPITDSLYEWIATEGTKNYFGRPVLWLDESGRTGDLAFDHSLLGDFLDSEELRVALMLVLGSADRLDDELQERFGGRRLSDPRENE